MERRGRVPIGGKLSRGVVSESLHPTSFPSPPPSRPLHFCTFLAGTEKRGRDQPGQTRLEPRGDAAAAPAADCPLGRAARLAPAGVLQPPPPRLLELHEPQVARPSEASAKLGPRAPQPCAHPPLAFCEALPEPCPAARRGSFV